MKQHDMSRHPWMGLALILTLGASGAQGTEAARPPSQPATDDGKARVQAQAEASLRKGLDWLKAAQRPDGTWSVSNFPAMTALGLWAFSRSDHPDKTAICARAAAFVAGCAQPDGGLYRPATSGRGSGGLSTYNTAICMSALHAYDRHRFAPIILAARSYVAGSQLQGDSDNAGGFGYERAAPMPAVAAPASGAPARGPRADLSNTGWALMAMRLTQDLEDLRPPTGAKADVNWQAAMRYVGTLQNNDPQDAVNRGGFGYERGGERGADGSGSGGTTLRGFGSMTYAGLESMLYAQVDRSDPRVRSAIDWAARHWSVEENPGMGAKGLYYYYTIMAKALNQLGSDTLTGADGKCIAWRTDLLACLVARQQPDGSWRNSDNTFWENDPALVTAYAALTLEQALGR